MAEKKQPDKEAAFTKAQLAQSARYSEKQDMITALLENGKRYTFSQVDEAVEQFLKRKVK